MSRFVIVAVTLLVIAVGSGRALWGGNSPPVLVALTEQTDRGKDLFRDNCAKCHGDQGQGTADGPPIIGTPNAIPTYMTAKGLFDFASKEMPADAPGSLMPQVYWDILAFILEANQLLPPNTTLGPENAATIRLSPPAAAFTTVRPAPRPSARRHTLQERSPPGL